MWTPNDTDADNTNDTANLPTITANGSDPNGTYKWEIIQGAGKVQLYDADTNTPVAMPTSQSVRIAGLMPSAALDDVQIKVTHTTADGVVNAGDLAILLRAMSSGAPGSAADPPSPADGEQRIFVSFFLIDPPTADKLCL